jgi:hypothetical protein
VILSRQDRRWSLLRRAAAVAASTVLILIAAIPGASAQSIEWTRQFGTTGFDVGRAVGMDETAVYVLGPVGGALPGQTYAGGPDDVYLRKYDQEGNELWTRQFGTSGDDFSMAGRVAIDDTALYVAGWTNGALPGETNAGDYDAFVRRHDTDGNEIWTDQFGGTAYDDIDGIAVHRGAIFVAGNTLSALPGQTSGGAWDAYVRRYDSDGNAVWTRQFGGTGSETAHSVAVDRTGVYVAGSVSSGAQAFGPDSDVLVLKYDFAGTLLWVRQFGTAGIDHAEGIAVWRGGVYVAGMTAGTLPGQTSAGGDDTFLRKYDADGNEVWTRQFGTAGNDSASFRGVVTDGRGVYITGNVAGALPGQTSAGSRDGFVRQYRHDGDELWTLQFGTSGDDRPIAIAVGSNEDVYVAGRTSGAFPGFTYAGGTDAFVAKLLRENGD